MARLHQPIIIDVDLSKLPIFGGYNLMMQPAFNYSQFYHSFTERERKYAPNQLYLAGDTSLLESGLRICVVGSRKMSTQGEQDAACISQALVGQGAIVVSGLAEGIDSVAHNTAIAFGGSTIAVLGTPLNVAYPAQNRLLLETIKSKHLAISQFPEGYPVKRENFPIRNRTMALLSDATIIVEASESSGTKHQGWEALRLGRLVFIMESVLNNPQLSWPKEMQKYGAQALSCELLPEILPDIPHVSSHFV